MRVWKGKTRTEEGRDEERKKERKRKTRDEGR